VKIVVTMSRPEELARRLEACGHEVAICPLIRIESLGDEAVDVSGYDWVVLTSVHGARELRRRLRGEPARVAAIGRATAEAFGYADLVPRVSTQEGLLEELPSPSGRVLFAGAEGARRLLVDALGADFRALYRTVPLRPERFPDGDLAVVASPSAVGALADLGVDIPVVSIGPQTTAAASEAGLRVVAEAERPDAESVLAAISRLPPCSSRS
jgi:uroporphyrinogen-III synthase